MENNASNNLSLKEDTKLHFITGAPRTRKTSKAMRESVTPFGQFSDSGFVYVGRTKKNARSAYGTFREHYDPPSNNRLPGYTSIMYFGTGESCENMPSTAEYIPNMHQSNCHKEKNWSEIPVIELMKIIEDNNRKLGKEVWEEINEKGYCGRAANDAYINYLESSDDLTPFVIFTTYASLQILLASHSKILEEKTVIFDEARHMIDQLSIVEQKSLNNRPKKVSYKEIWRQYKQSVSGLDIDDLIEDSKLQYNIERLLEEYFEYLDAVFEGWKKAEKMQEDWVQNDVYDYPKIKEKFAEGYRPNLNNLEINGEIYQLLRLMRENGETELYPPEHFLVRDVPDFNSVESVLNELSEVLNPKNDEKLLKLWRTLDLIKKLSGDKVEADFDFIENSDNEKTLNLIFRKRNGDSESRDIFHNVLKKAEYTVATDATPLPPEYNEFFFGTNDLEVQWHEKEMKFEFDLLVEDISCGRRATYRDPDNTKRVYRKVDLLQHIFEMYDQDTVVFGRDKLEASRLEKLGIRSVYYSRGSDSEGTSKGSGIVISLGIPMQNIHSEDYRKFDIARAINSNKPDEAIQNFRNIKATQELLQHSFRTVDQEKEEGRVVILNTRSDYIEEYSKHLSWLDDIEPYYMITKSYPVSEKLMEIEEIMFTDEEEYVISTCERIKKEIKSYLGANGRTKKTELINSITGDTGTKREIVNNMIEENILEMERGENNSKNIDLNED